MGIVNAFLMKDIVPLNFLWPWEDGGLEHEWNKGS